MANDKTKPVGLSPTDAHKYLTENPHALLVDCRTEMEFLFIGHPAGARHVAWLDEPDWVVNPHFVTDIRKLMLGGSVTEGEINTAPVLLVCRSGKRSYDAGLKLLASGFTHVFNVEEGFEGELDENHQRGNLGGWRFHGLPWLQS
ncbi:MAG: rhodanese-like domain-containing protein [Gammaproteobacteria bacterium]|nr:rhodanese-like domain-containing protein [Gammaproteobacteria bacterium]